MIPVNEPSLGEKEMEYVAECVRTGWVSSSGPFIERFEAGWAEYCHRRHGMAVANGTVALELALACLGLKPGDEVILPTFTIISCALAVLRNGGVPVLVDADPRTWCIDVSQIEASITPRTRVIMPVHIYGHPTDMGPLLQLARKRGLVVVEDAAEAHGAEYRDPASVAPQGWRRCGSFGLLSCFSFYANKLITTGEGGMVLTDDPELASEARRLRNLCFGSERRFRHEREGYNFRLTNLQAALGLGQLERIDAIVSRKRWIGREYSRRLAHVGGLQLPVEEPWARSVYWMFGVVVREETGLDAEAVARRLAEKEVETRPFFLGMHEQPVMRNRGLFLDRRYPVAERLARQGLYLPSGLGLTEPQLDHVCRAVEDVLV